MISTLLPSWLRPVYTQQQIFCRDLLHLAPFCEAAMRRDEAMQYDATQRGETM